MSGEIEAAERILMQGAEQEEHYWATGRSFEADAVMVAREYVARLAADRAEREERERPADDDWLYPKTRGVRVALKWHSDTREVFLGGVSIGIKKTRGEWVDLLRVLKGGAE